MCWKNVQFQELNFDGVLHQDANTTSTFTARQLDQAKRKPRLFKAAIKQQLS